MKTIILNLFYLMLFIAAILALCYFLPVWITQGIIMLLIIAVLCNVYLVLKRIDDGEKK